MAPERRNFACPRLAVAVCTAAVSFQNMQPVLPLLLDPLI